MALVVRAAVGAALVFGLAGVGGCAPAVHVDGAPWHHLNGGFRNPPHSPERRGGPWAWTAFFARRIGENIFSGRPTPPRDQVQSPAATRRGFDGLGAGDSLTWLGHAAFLLRLDGTTVLTDPFLSEYATGFPPFGPKRYAGPGLGVGDLPPVDVLVVSHNHFDHLDAPTIEALPGKERIDVVVPLGLGTFFRERGYVRVHELDWHQSVGLRGLTVTALPVVHASGRGLFDRNATLWTGYAVASPSRRLFFSGDTAYGPVFGELGARYGPFDYALLPIGGYQPRLLMDGSHVTPEEAVRLARDLGARTVVGMHWGTIRLTDEAAEEPPRRFRAAGRRAGFGDARLWVMRIGETRGLD